MDLPIVFQYIYISWNLKFDGCYMNHHISHWYVFPWIFSKFPENSPKCQGSVWTPALRGRDSSPPAEWIRRPWRSRASPSRRRPPKRTSKSWAVFWVQKNMGKSRGFMVFIRLFFVFYMNFHGFWVVFRCCISGDIWFLDCFEMGLRWCWDVFVDGCWLELGENLRNSWKNTKETGAFKDKLQNGEHTKHVNVDGQY